MARIFIRLADRERADKRSVIYLVTYLQGKRVRINTGELALKEEWNEDLGCLKGKKNADRNLIIESCRERISETLIRYRLQNKELTEALLKTEYKNPSYGVDFLKFMDEAIRERKGEIEASSMKQHRVVITKLKSYRKSIAFSELTPDFLSNWSRHLKAHYGNDLNTVASNMAKLKAYINIAIRKELMTKNPFDNYSIRKAEPEIVFLTELELSKLWNAYQIYKYPKKQKSLRRFLFMCFTGLRISDLEAITHEESVFDTRLVFLPYKTRNQKRKMVMVPLTKNALRLIDDEATAEGFIFPRLSEQTLSKNIKDVAKGENINKNLSTKTGRHTFATLFLQKTRDLATLQKLLGHSKIATTMVYVHVTPDHISGLMTEFESSLDLTNEVADKRESD